ncbi:MAG: hypothetical protein IPH21_15955 [Flavobacteriales bacterium]|nr:hypothetical protein [Flavobacteriales bacterium]
MAGRRIAIFSILICGILLGAAREFTFLNLNYQIDFLANNRTDNYAHSLFQGWVDGSKLSTLIFLKWGLAFAFAGSMCILRILLLRRLFGDHRYAKYTVIGFILLGLIATIFHFLSLKVPAFEGVSIKLLHLIQYPALLFFVWAGAGLVKPRSYHKMQ